MSFSRSYGPWAIVTGASSGIGEAFARALAARSMNVVLVARRVSRLEALAGELESAHRIQARVLGTDLAKADDRRELVRAVADLDVGLLVNNAGLSHKGRLLELDLAEQERMVSINCTATLALTREIGGRMLARDRAGIIVVSSTGAFQGLPFSAVYGATKGFGLLLAEALSVELRESGIDVLAVCPGATDTEGPVRTGVDASRVPGGLMSPVRVVEVALSSLGQRTLAIPGTMNRLAAFVTRFVPRGAAARSAGAALVRVTPWLNQRH